MCRVIGVLFVLALGLMPCAAIVGQPLDRVLMRIDESLSSTLAVDQGSMGLWQQLLKLETTASLLHTTAHPDDEHAGMLTMMGRGKGIRTALLTLNRGEGGANAMGAERFDALGMIRTEELLRAGRYYGLDDQYFTAVTDYGYSKMLEEAIRNWGRDFVLGEMVRVIRLNRPLVVVSRFHGSQRDGHGHHQAAGGLTPEAVVAAADPSRYPEHLEEEGLRTWKVRKVYRGGVRDQEPWHVHLDAGTYSPVLGQSFQHFGMYGLSLQRSQTSGRMWYAGGPAPYYYERLDAPTDQERSFFEGLDTTLPGVFTLVEEEAPGDTESTLRAVAGHVAAARSAFQVDDMQPVVPHLAEGLRLLRQVLEQIPATSDVHFILQVKEKQFMAAINTAMGISVSALAMPEETRSTNSPWLPPPTMDVVIPGQTIRVETQMTIPALATVQDASVTLVGGARWHIEAIEDNQASDTGRPQVFRVHVPADAPSSSTTFSRANIGESRYTVHEQRHHHRPSSPPALFVVGQYRIHDVLIQVRAPVQVQKPDLPFGYVRHEMKVLPALGVHISPQWQMIALEKQEHGFEATVTLSKHTAQQVEGRLRLNVPPSWQVEPEAHSFTLRQNDHLGRFTFTVHPSSLTEQAYTLTAYAEVGNQTYREGYEGVTQRGLETHYLFRPAEMHLRGVPVHMASGLRVGYVMGVGDEVPAAIEQLGAHVDLLLEDDLAEGDLDQYAVIVVGTRAYAVRSDLLTYNQRLLDYAKRGGHLVVLYQTPEYNPEAMAPYPASLPFSAQEVSEEDAPVDILAPDHPVLHIPNTITSADFEGWIEQRGSKFWASWDAAYTPLLSSHDTGQDPQEGGWLVAQVEAGYFTYFAYAVHRQTPYAVPGMYRLFANILSLGQTP